VYSLLFLFIILTGFAYTTLLERIVIARLQQRVGPNRVGPFGLLQPAADAVKLITKEDIMPAGAYKPVYLISPILKSVPTLIVLAVVPLGPDLLIPWFDGRWYQVPLGLADVNVGILWILAITSIGTYGVALAGWSSNNKYAMLGGLRATAQMLSYELSLGLTMAVPILIVGSMSIGDIIRQQEFIYEWFIFQNPLAFVILFIALLAEVNRAPFDLPEAEQELTAGYMTEYSGMKFGLIMLAEYVGMIGISAIVSALYLGGYQDGFGLVNHLPILGPIVFVGKILLFLVLMIWIRATLPRIRYDRLMSFGWKVMLPLALVAVVWTAISVVVGDTFQSPIAYGIAAGIMFALVAVFGYLYVTRATRAEAEDEPALEDDPVITGVQRGPAYLGLQVLGGIIAIPFILYEFTVKALVSLLDFIAALFGRDDQGGDDAGRTTTAIETTSETRARSGGD
jgi:NADH-quinone oxidoreductase subunit H